MVLADVIEAEIGDIEVAGGIKIHTRRKTNAGFDDTQGPAFSVELNNGRGVVVRDPRVTVSIDGQRMGRRILWQLETEP